MKQKSKEIVEQNPNFLIKLNMKSGKEIVLSVEFHKLNFDTDKKFLSVSGPNHQYLIRYDDIESLDYVG
jgi:hypothetical protein